MSELIGETEMHEFLLEGVQLLLNAKKVIRHCEANSFWAIMDLLEEEKAELGGQGFYNNRTILLDAYKQDKFFVLSYEETRELYEKRILLMPHILDQSFDSLHSFCTLDENNEIDII
jgi:hypothetical protein